MSMSWFCLSVTCQHNIVRSGDLGIIVHVHRLLVGKWHWTVGNSEKLSFFSVWHWPRGLQIMFFFLLAMPNDHTYMCTLYCCHNIIPFPLCMLELSTGKVRVVINWLLHILYKHQLSISSNYAVTQCMRIMMKPTWWVYGVIHVCTSISRTHISYPVNTLQVVAFHIVQQDTVYM